MACMPDNIVKRAPDYWSIRSYLMNLTSNKALMDAEPTTLKVCSLNAWGLPLESCRGVPGPFAKNRMERFKLLATELAKGKYDIIALQEIWKESDFVLLRDAVQAKLQYAHYFHSGFIGSGVCLFSKHPLISSQMHRFSLNGFAHHVHRGDWFGGKVVGLAQIRIRVANRPVTIHMYSTHIHAEYDRINDLYLPHRIVQAYELSQFVKHTSCGADLVILTGDLNLEPVDLGYRFILGNSTLKDAYMEAPHVNVDEHEGNTCDRPDNIYSLPESASTWPHGKRIDYIMYCSLNNVRASVKSCDVVLNKVPDSDLCFSDHAGVEAEFSLTWSDSKIGLSNTRQQSADANEMRTMLTEATNLVDVGTNRVQSDFRLFVACFVVLMFVYFLTVDLELTYPAVALPAMFCRFILSVIICFCLWYGVIGLQLESKALKGAKQGMLVLSDALTRN